MVSVNKNTDIFVHESSKKLGSLNEHGNKSYIYTQNQEQKLTLHYQHDFTAS